MTKLHLYDKIISPLVTEKSTNLSEQNKIIFKVNVNANKKNIKTNIETLESPLDKISKLRGDSYNIRKSNESSIGMIAEEVEEIFPELVTKDKSGNASAMSYVRMTAVLLEAIKELKEEVD